MYVLSVKLKCYRGPQSRSRWISIKVSVKLKCYRGPQPVPQWMKERGIFVVFIYSLLCILFRLRDCGSSRFKEGVSCGVFWSLAQTLARKTVKRCSKTSWLQDSTLRACWNITRDDRARLIWSNRDFFRILQIYLQYLLSYILKFQYMYTRGEILGCLLGFWPLGQNSTGAITHCTISDTALHDLADNF